MPKEKGSQKVEKPAFDDTTEYLLSNSINKERLLQAVTDLKNQKHKIRERELIEK